jgi:hypothetical protein
VKLDTKKGLKMSKDKLMLADASVTDFDVVDSHGTLQLSNFQIRNSRADFYENVAQFWSQSPADLADAMQECQPLSWAVFSIYEKVRSEIVSAIEELDQTSKDFKKESLSLKVKLDLMPEDPENGACLWLLSLTTLEFEHQVIPIVSKWFEDSPSRVWEDEHLPLNSTAQGCALEFFHSIDGDDLDRIGVTLVEGEHPGSSYHAAVLAINVSTANSQAHIFNIPVRFHRKNVKEINSVPSQDFDEGEEMEDLILSPNELIKISCEGTSAPGCGWVIQVEFRPLKKGFSVWLYQDNNDVDKPSWKKVGSLGKKLSWRTAYEYLSGDEDIRVYGDLWATVYVEGLPKYTGDILKFVFIDDVDNSFGFKRIGELLLGFSDTEIRDLCSQNIYDFQEPINIEEEKEANSDFQHLYHLSCLAHRAKLIGLDFKTIKMLANVEKNCSIESLVNALRNSVDHIRKNREKNLIAKTKCDPVQPESLILAVETHSQASGISCPIRNWIDISKEQISKSPTERIELISAWLHESIKPTGGGVQIGNRENSEWPIIKWLLGSTVDSIFDVLFHLNKAEPKLAISLASEVMSRGKKEAYYFEGPNRFQGWAQNVIGRHLHREHVTFAIQFQEAANRLQIPIAESQRIGNLPYLK